MDAVKTRTIAGYIGRSGSGKTTLIQTHVLALSRSVIWDWRGEYPGLEVTRRALAPILKKKTFAVRVRPTRWAPLVDGFAALAHVISELGENLTVVCDEVALVTPDRKEGGIGHLLRYARPQGIGLLWATQRPTGIPGILLSESRTLYCFHCDARADVSTLNQYVPLDVVEQIATLPPYKFVKVDK